jgi:hypothetical protein
VAVFEGLSGDIVDDDMGLVLRRWAGKICLGAEVILMEDWVIRFRRDEVGHPQRCWCRGNRWRRLDAVGLSRGVTLGDVGPWLGGAVRAWKIVVSCRMACSWVWLSVAKGAAGAGF